MMSSMSVKVVYFSKPFSQDTLGEADRDATLLVFSPSAVDAVSGQVLDRLVHRRSMAIAVADGRLSGLPFAAACFCDYFALGEDSLVDLGVQALVPEVAAAVTWRVPERARRILLGTETALDADRALELGISDALVPRGSDSLKWAREWLGKRSLRALLSASILIRTRGGDLAERAEFGRLFGEGEPQRGLRGFLDKKPVDFSEDIEVVTV
jgi:enoyl-CoA hydratase/carnithine racemase